VKTRWWPTTRAVLSAVAVLLIALLMSARAGSRVEDDPAKTDSKPSMSTGAEPDDVGDFFTVVGRCQEVLLHTPYTADFIDTVVSALNLDLEPPYDESAILMVTLGPVGFVEELALKSVSSPILEAPFQLLIAAPPAFPRAPRDVLACLGPRPFPMIVKLARKFRCEDQEAYRKYHEQVGLRLYQTSTPLSIRARRVVAGSASTQHSGPRGRSAHSTSKASRIPLRAPSFVRRSVDSVRSRIRRTSSDISPRNP
jgi:hypothetical protein